MKEDIEAIQVLVDEILKAIKKISGASNNLILKQGNIISKSGDNAPWKYSVKIDGELYTINSYISFSVGKLVNVLCSVNGIIKVLLG